MAPGPPCNEQLVQYTNEHDWPGGFSLPAMFRLHNRSHMVFAAEDASRAQTVVLQPMPVNPSSPPHKVVHTGAVAPGRRDEHFGGFFDFTSAETGELGFVGVGNKSVPLAQRFFGVYVVADPFRLPHPVVEKVVDTLDNVPGGLPHAKRWHALSAPALYRSPSGPGGGLSLIFSGRDYAAPATRGRDLIMKWRASTRSLQMLAAKHPDVARRVVVLPLGAGDLPLLQQILVQQHNLGATMLPGVSPLAEPKEHAWPYYPPGKH